MRIFQYFRFFSQRYYAAGFFAGKLDCSARGGISSILPCLFFADRFVRRNVGNEVNFVEKSPRAISFLG